MVPTVLVSVPPSEWVVMVEGEVPEGTNTPVALRGFQVVTLTQSA